MFTGMGVQRVRRRVSGMVSAGRGECLVVDRVRRDTVEKTVSLYCVLFAVC